MDTELWLITGAMVVFFAQWLLLLWAQNKITRLESLVRGIRWDLQTALDQLGPLSADDAEALQLISQYTAVDHLTQCFGESA